MIIVPNQNNYFYDNDLFLIIAGISSMIRHNFKDIGVPG
jgi:hypothetical protein